MNKPFTVTVTIDLEAADAEEARDAVRQALSKADVDDLIDEVSDGGVTFTNYSVSSARLDRSEG